MVFRVKEVCNGHEYNVPARSNSGEQNNCNAEKSMPTLSPEIKSDMFQVKKTIQPLQEVEKEVHRLDAAQKALYLGGILPPLRRIGSLPCSLEHDDYTRAALLVGMAAANLPGDIREISRAGKEFSEMLKGVMPSARNYKGQHTMTMLDGTFLEPVTKLKGLRWLDKIDEPIYDNFFGKWLRDKLHLGFDKSAVNTMKIPGLKIAGKELIPERVVSAFNLKGNYAQKLAGKSLMRISNLSLIFGAILEAPALIRSVKNTEGTSIDKTKAFGKQMLKSSAYIALSAGFIAVAGAAFGVTAIGSLAGMAVGSAVSLMASNMFNKQVDKVFKADEKEQHFCPSQFA